MSRLQEVGALRRALVAVVALMVLLVAGAAPAGAGGNGRGSGPGAAERPRQHAVSPSARGGHAQRPPARVSRSARPHRPAPAAHRGHGSQHRGHQGTPQSDHGGRPGAEAKGKSAGDKRYHDGASVQVLSSSAARPTPVASPEAAPSAPASAPAPRVAAPRVAAPTPVRAGPQQLVGPLPVAVPLDPPVLATPTFVQRIVERFPDLPPLPAQPRLIEDPAFPLALVALLGLFVAITGRGDRRDPKLTKAELDARGREIGFS